MIATRAPLSAAWRAHISPMPDAPPVMRTASAAGVFSEVM
jgi:hypothetical protein